MKKVPQVYSTMSWRDSLLLLDLLLLAFPKPMSHITSVSLSRNIHECAARLLAFMYECIHIDTHTINDDQKKIMLEPAAPCLGGEILEPNR